MVVCPVGFVEQLKNKNNIQFELFRFFSRGVSRDSLCSPFIHIVRHFALSILHFTCSFACGFRRLPIRILQITDAHNRQVVSGRTAMHVLFLYYIFTARQHSLLCRALY